ncbi:MAG: cysteine-rich CWC family protein [Candidatus Cloacimonadota bacterium]|nr:cysteine-rich CWC family protein [Candidatus Cloacimonadota bacterium]
MKGKVIESICPICGKDNNCMAHSNEPCWCNNVEIPQELLDLVPDSKKNKACICLKCIQDFKDDSQKFIRKRILHNS